MTLELKGEMLHLLFESTNWACDNNLFFGEGHLKCLLDCLKMLSVSPTDYYVVTCNLLFKLYKKPEKISWQDS